MDAADANASYWHLVGVLRAGGRLPEAAIERALTAAGRTHRDLVRDIFSDATGDACAQCGGHLHVYSSHGKGSIQVQYLCCAKCDQRPANNKRTVSRALIRRKDSS